MPIGPTRFSRKALAALAILAALLALLRPICESWHALALPAAPVHAAWVAAGPVSAGAHSSDPLCCPYAEEMGAMATEPALPGAATWRYLPAPTVSFAFAAIALALIGRVVPRRTPIAPTPRSFYLRSARIRR